ncbi:hypothetical protein KUV85_03115 [Nocardioides panacisoli]|uniref:ribonuclease domain-containing protein n=1 Tax=Nocardioides panacisoli TaxID=627624 RepID=UPI001C639543|nr:ribonuclease domain-containing protein [Nocardioides panacisoli]QYJ04686.1 hypothetical protein KUV85_03115 [Nocardioides panacisoli]
MRTDQVTRLVRLAGRGRAGLVTAVVLGLLLVGGWWLQDGGAGVAPEAQDRTTPSATSAPTEAPSSDRSSTAPSAAPSTGSTPTPATGTDPASGLPYVALATLPPEADDTLRLIDAGGPFPHPDHDDETFHNYEGILPDEPDGYYREYTVETPGLDHRGARRIVTGGDGTAYWTSDHYDSFSVIVR